MNQSVESKENVAQSSQHLTRKSNKSFLWRALIVIAILTFSIIGFVSFISTASGIKWAVELANKFVNGLNIAEVEGDLQRGLTLKNVQFQTEGIDSQLEQLNVQLDFSCLLKAEICVKQLHFTKPNIYIQTALLPTTEAVEKSPAAVRKDGFSVRKGGLLVSVEAHNIRIEQVKLHIDNQQIHLGELTTGAQLNNQDGLTFDSTEINDLFYVLKTDSTPKGSQSETQSQLDWQVLKQALSKPLLQNIDEVKLPFNIHIPLLQAKNWQFQQVVNGNPVQKIAMATLQLQANIINSIVKLERFNFVSSIADLKGSGDIRLQQNFPIYIDLSANLHPFKQGETQILPQSNVELLISGNLKKSTVLSLKSQGDIEADLTAELQLSTAKIPFELKLDVSKFAYPFEKLEKLLQIKKLKFNIDGDLLEHQLSLQGEVLGIDSLPAQLSLQAKSGLSYLDVNHFQLDYTNNHIVASGHLSEKRTELNLDVNAPNLSGLIPGLSATLIGKANLNGNLNQPDLYVDLSGHSIQWQDLKIAKIELKGEVRSRDYIEANLNLDLNNFNQGDIKVNKVKLRLTGDERNHYLQLQSNGEPIAANFEVNGHFDRAKQTWQGKLSQVVLRTMFGNIMTDQNIDFSFDNQQGITHIASHCWRHNEVELCFPQSLNLAKTGDIPFEIKYLDLALINQLTKQEQLLQGKVSSYGKLNWYENQPLQLDMYLKGDNLTFIQKINHRTFKLAVPKLKVDIDLANNNLRFKSDIQVENNGRIQTDLTIYDLMHQRKLGGDLNIRNINLSLANQLLTANDQVAGEVLAELTVTGDLNSPLLKGAVNIRQLQTKIKSSLVQINDGYLDLNFYGDRSVLDGEIQTTAGQLSINGEADWQSIEDWQAYINAKTDRFSINIPAMARAVLNSDITIKAQPNALNLEGKVNIPSARIEIEELPNNAVTVSEDEIILTPKAAGNRNIFPAQQETVVARSSVEIKSNVKITLGDDVRIKAYGLNSQLDGLLSVHQEKGTLGLFGQVNLKNGHYTSFGQDLLIRKGQISFSGSPSQPFLIMEAIRNPNAMEDQRVTVGVKVNGVANSPNVEIFSEPNTSQAETLSYLITGRSLNTSRDLDQRNSAGLTLLGIGLAKTGKLFGSIGKAFGIQDLTLNTTGTGEKPKVVIGGNLTRRLNIKYGVGLFDGLSDITLRYSLLPQLFLQYFSGVNQAVDLLYEFEF